MHIHLRTIKCPSQTTQLEEEEEEGRCSPIRDFLDTWTRVVCVRNCVFRTSFDSNQFISFSTRTRTHTHTHTHTGKTPPTWETNARLTMPADLELWNRFFIKSCWGHIFRTLVGLITLNYSQIALFSDWQMFEFCGKIRGQNRRKEIERVLCLTWLL